MFYQDTITYLDSFVNYEKKTRYRYKDSFKLERIREFLSRVGSPQAGLSCVHVAGTKGKGSVCAFTAFVLRQQGYTVGLYTSPHLNSVRERIRILYPGTAGSFVSDDFEGMISEEELSELVERLRPEIELFRLESSFGPLSFFEIYTALALIYFKQKAVDFAVMETGLGGRLDATNVVAACAAGITSISYDHTDKLGSTLAEIASEKAGIIKESADKSAPLVVISAPQVPEAAGVIRSRCEQAGAVLYEVGRDISYEIVSSSLVRQTLNIKGPCGTYEGLDILLPGEHQAVNAAVAVGLASAAVSGRGDILSPKAVLEGLHVTRWPGRCEIAGRSPEILLDGAHNGASAEVLSLTLRRYMPDKKIILIIGVSKDKDVDGICRHLAPLAWSCIVTKSENPRALSTHVLAQSLSVCAPGIPVRETSGVAEALSLARSSAREGDSIVITGSLFIVGEARKLLCRPEKEYV